MAGMSEVELIARNSNKHLRNATADMLSNLPSDVLQRILEYLPLRDAVRMSILSTRWRYKWTLIPRLILDEDFLQQNLRIKSVVSTVEILEDSNIISNILLCHVGPIHKFVLHIPFWFVKYAQISRWIQFLSGKAVHELTLNFVRRDFERKLSSSVFSCVGFDSLTHLTIFNFNLPSFPSTFRGFPHLISLQLHMVPVLKTEGANLLGSLVSKCPMLESLNLRVYILSSLSIHAPKLQNLFLSGRLYGISLEEIKQIKTLSLQASCNQEWVRMIKLFTCLPHVEKLLLGGDFWSSRELLKDGFVEKLKHSNELRQLKHLILHGAPLHCGWAVSFIFGLFQTNPKLQELEISVGDTVPHLEYMIVEDECCFYHLKCAKVCCGTHSPRLALQLIERILLSSPFLEVMTIEVRELVTVDASVRAQEMLKITKELLEYRRASTNAHIIFKSRLTYTVEF